VPVADTISRQDPDADGDPRTMSFLLKSTGLVATVRVPEGFTHPLTPSHSAYRALLAVTRLGQDYLVAENIQLPETFSLARARTVTTSVLHSARVGLPPAGASTEAATP
jgi:hypothetical protein